MGKRWLFCTLLACVSLLPLLCGLSEEKHLARPQESSTISRTQQKLGSSENVYDSNYAKVAMQMAKLRHKRQSSGLSSSHGNTLEQDVTEPLEDSTFEDDTNIVNQNASMLEKVISDKNNSSIFSSKEDSSKPLTNSSNFSENTGNENQQTIVLDKTGINRENNSTSILTNASENNIDIFQPHSNSSLFSSNPFPNLTDSLHGTCLFNICNHQAVCSNGGTCILNNTDCSVYCQCPPDIDPRLYDSFCHSLDLSVNASRSLSPSHASSKQCDGLGQFECINGVCNVSESSSHGGLSYSCDCDEGWSGVFCEVPCSRNCSNGGRCRYDAVNDTELCDCVYPWIGADCTEVKPEEESDLAIWVGGGSALVLILVLIFTASFLYCLWKKRLIFALKLIYYFQPFEDNDGRQYDAFLSYVCAERDHDFVLRTLCPGLETRYGFSLCIHYRDFLPGEVISDNIVTAVENSRRFILVLSPNYLECQWAQFEFQQAFQEMLKRRVRIIPVVLDNIQLTNEHNPTLRNILESITPITYPGDRASEKELNTFWKKLVLSMPKVKDRNASLGASPQRTASGSESHRGAVPAIFVTDASDEIMEETSPQRQESPPRSQRNFLCCLSSENGTNTCSKLRRSRRSVEELPGGSGIEMEELPQAGLNASRQLHNDDDDAAPRSLGALHLSVSGQASSSDRVSPAGSVKTPFIPVADSESVHIVGDTVHYQRHSTE